MPNISPDPRPEGIFWRNVVLDDDDENFTGDNLHEAIFGNWRDNVLTGLDGSDTLIGHGGDDTLDGGKQSDHLGGGSGNDILIGGEGADLLYGDAGIDTIKYYGWMQEGVTVDLQSGRGSGGDAQGDKIYDVENVDGSRYDDKLSGKRRRPDAKGNGRE